MPRLVLVSAPAGFGTTTLPTPWLRLPSRRGRQTAGGNPRAERVGGRSAIRLRAADWAAWKRLLRQAGVRDARMHDTRHTAATLLLQQGVAPRVAMPLLGHSQLYDDAPHTRGAVAGAGRRAADGAGPVGRAVLTSGRGASAPQWQPRWARERCNES